jgi:hypothetical protein
LRAVSRASIASDVGVIERPPSAGNGVRNGATEKGNGQRKRT